MSLLGQVAAPTFDIETWISNYDGTLFLLRLAHAAIRCPSVAQQCLSIAVAAAKKSRDVAQYTRLSQLASEMGFVEIGTADREWVLRQDEANRRELQRLESELRGYKNNLIRESIRMGQEDLATHLLLTGGPLPDPSDSRTWQTSGYNAAYQAFVKMRDHCTTPTHVASMSLKLIYTSLVQALCTLQQTGNAGLHFNTMLTNAARLKVVGVKEEEQLRLNPMASVASGLAHLSLGGYKEAGRAFLQTPFSYHTLEPLHGTDYTRAMAAGNDVAIYGGLCALATFDRGELMEVVLGGDFRPFLELEPHVRKAISLFTTAKYQACLTTLQRYYSDWSLDIFLGAAAGSGQMETVSHLDRLFAMIREKSITAYLTSFSEISLSALQLTFPLNSNASLSIEDEILQMIQNGTLKARLDVVNGVVMMPIENSRLATQEKAKMAADEIERTLLLRLHRVNMTLAGFEVTRRRPHEHGGFLPAENPVAM